MNKTITLRVIASLLLGFFSWQSITSAAGVTINSGATVTQSGSASITTNGNWDNNGTFTAGAGTVELNGTASTILEAGTSSFNNLIVNKTAAADANDNVTVQTNNLSVTGALTVTDGEIIQGTTDFTLSGLSVAAAGKYSNASTGDLTLAGAVANAGIITFDAGGGGPGGADSVLIRSSILNTQRNWQGAGTFTMVDVDVRDQTALGGTPAAIAVSSGTNTGNNINWLFGAVTLAGVAYTSKSEAATLNSKNLTIVQFRGGTQTTYTTTTDGTGNFSIGMTDAQSGDPIVIYLNNEAEEGNLVYISDGLNVANLKLYQNEVALRNDTGSGVTNTNLSDIDDSDDDIKYNVAAGTATFESAFEVFIFTGSTYAPGGAVVLNDIDLNGSFTMLANAVTVSGVWDATGGAYSSTGTVTFNATVTENLTSNGDSALASFNHVVFSGVLGQWDLQDNLDVDGNLTITNGTLNANGFNINAAGNWTNSATFTSGAGTVLFDGVSTQTLTSTGTGIAGDDTGIDFNNLTVSGSTLQIASGSELEVDGTLTVNASRFLDLNAATFDLNGTLQNLGTVILEGSETLGFAAWDTDSGTTRYVGNTVTLPVSLATYFNLEFDEAVDGQTFTLPDVALTVNGVFTVTDGIAAFDNDKNVTLNDTGVTGTALSLAAAGILNNTGTGDLLLGRAVANAGTITFNSSDDAGNGISILSTGSPTQRNWQGAGTFSMTDVTVLDQTVTGGAPASITAISSTNGGGNVNWLFGGGALAAVTVTPADLQAGQTSNNTVVFTTTSAIPSNGKIRVTFPAGFNVAGVTTATSASDLNGSLAVGISGQDVTITRSGGTNFTAGGTVDDLVVAGVVNPGATGLTGTFTVATLDPADTIIDTGTAPGVTIIPFTSTASAVAMIDLTGAPVTAYTLGSVNTGKIYVRITDSDENTNGGVAETVIVTLTSAATGDSEVITLTETGVNTGIFENTATGVIYDADDIAIYGNGTLETRHGDTVTASYIDNDDATDTSSSNASIRASEDLITCTLSATPNEIRVGEMITFVGTLENRTAEVLTGFKLVSDLPPGVILQPGSAEVSSGTVLVDEGGGASFVQLSPLDPAEKRTLKFRVIAGSGATPGSYPVTFYAQVNPIISNTAQVTLLLRPDPVFHVGTLIGKVFWDINRNGVQDDGEIGIPNATVATEQGHVITTDQYGRYHLPDFLSGRHMVKIDRNSLPDGSRLTTPEAVVISQTDAMLNKVNFGVVIPEEAAALYDRERESDITLMVRKDPASPVKSFALEFHEIRPAEDEKLPLIQSQRLLEQLQGGHYLTKNSEELPVLPFRLNMNYASFVKKWSFELNRYEKPETTALLPQDPKDRQRQTLEIAKQEGEPTASAFRYTWNHPLTEEADGKKKEIPYELRVTLEDEKGNQDIAVYDLIAHVSEEEIDWEIVPVDVRESIPVSGTTVILEGKTHANKIVSAFGREDLTSADGAFTAQAILPQGKREVPVLLYLKPDEKPVRVTRLVDLRDTYLFWVGFSEMEWGQLNIKGNINSVTSEDKARFQEEWYDESRVAYYLKGKVKGKYLITASVDTQREKRELFRNLEPEDYYAVYGDKSSVTADANDTQDKYYLLAEVDKSYLKYGNFATDMTGTEFADFNRTLHGVKMHYETLSTAPDGKAVTFVSAFTARARQSVARNEFLATGSALYYLKHKGVVMGSDKIKVVTRDKVSGLPLSERVLSRESDYSIDYDEGRIRLYRPILTFTFSSDSILSTELLAGHPQYLTAEYEFETQEFLEDRTSGVRAGQAFLNDRVRVAGTYVTEERSLKRFELKGADGSVQLPFGTEIQAEVAQSSLQAAGEFLSRDGGLSFNEITHAAHDGAGQAYRVSIASSPVKELDIASYYRTLAPGFSSSGTLSEAGTEKYGFAADYVSGKWGELHLKHEYERLIDSATAAVNLSGTDVQTTDWFQYKYERDRWRWTAEYRDTRQTSLQEHLAGIEGRYEIDQKTQVAVAAQASIESSVSNNQLRGTLTRKIMNDLSVDVTQAFGNKGSGTLLGLEGPLVGPQKLSKGFGLLKEKKKKEEKKEEPEPTTEVGFTKNLGKDTEVKFAKKIGSKDKAGRTMRLTRTTADGRTLEMVQDSSPGSVTSSYSETVPLTKDISEYTQSSTTEDKLTGEKIQTETRGFKANVLGGRGSLYEEEQSSSAAAAERQGRKLGGKLMIDEHSSVDLSYEHNQDKKSEAKTDTQAAHLVYDYYDYDKLRATNSWDLQANEGVQKTTQLLSTGKAEFFINPEWVWLGRYEWSFSEDKVTSRQAAFFSEIQSGFAYRPIDNDRLNLFAEYKYLNDQGPLGQADISSEARSVRQVARAELAYDVLPRVTFVEKLALRDSDTLLTSGTRVQSLSYLAAQRINFHLTDRWDLIGEYRYLGQTLAEDSTQGILVETSYRITDALRLSVGYNTAKFESDLARDMDVELRGFYVRVFYDAIEEVRGVLEKRRQKTQEVAGELQEELVRASGTRGREKEVAEMKARLQYARGLMEKMLYEEAIEVLQQGFAQKEREGTRFDFYFQQGQMLHKNGLYGHAFKSYEKCYRINAFHPGLVERMSETRREIQRLLRLKRRVKLEQKKEFERLKLIHDTQKLALESMRMHYEIGKRYFGHGLYEEAMEEWQRGFELAKTVENGPTVFPESEEARKMFEKGTEILNMAQTRPESERK